jgi:hypothetical protein
MYRSILLRNASITGIVVNLHAAIQWRSSFLRLASDEWGRLAVEVRPGDQQPLSNLSDDFLYTAVRRLYTHGMLHIRTSCCSVLVWKMREVMRAPLVQRHVSVLKHAHFYARKCTLPQAKYT